MKQRRKTRIVEGVVAITRRVAREGIIFKPVM